MKKILLIIFSIFLSIGIYSQQYKTYTYSTTFTLTASSNDTINVWALLDRDFIIGAPYSISFEYTLTTSDVKIGLLAGNNPWSYGYESMDGVNTMLTLDNTAYKDNFNVDRKVDNFSSGDPFLFRRMGFQVITNTEVTGTILVTFVQRLYY